MSHNIFITRRIPEIAIQMLRDKGYMVDVYPGDHALSQEELINTLKGKDYTAVISLLTDKLDKKVFESAPSVKIFANYATGFDNIDLAEASRHGIAVTNSPTDISSEAVAQHTIALILTLARRIVEAVAFVRAGKYTGWSPTNFIGIDFNQKTLGLIGTGAIGQKVARYAKCLGFNIAYTDIIKNDSLEKECAATYHVNVDDLLKTSDIVSLHVPLLDSTRHLIHKAKFQMMKPTSLLVNTSRGAVIDEKALVEALEKKTIAGAGLDVFEFEPDLAIGLSNLSNVIFTPHIASASIEARDAMAKIAALNIIDFLEGRTPRNLITH